MVFLSSCISEDRIEQSREEAATTVYGTRWAGQDIPQYTMPENGMPERVAYRLIKDDIALDGNPALNLASFVTTFMEKEAEKLMMENLSKNFIDFEEYPQTAELCNRCVNIIARLFNAPMGEPQAEALGCSAVGSSEAIILATLAMKRRWQLNRKANNLPANNPNLVLGANCQVAWHKALRYLEIEGREVATTEEKLYMDPEKAVNMVDENTIGVCAILGSTFTGHYEDVETLNKLLDAKCKENGWNIGIHVDAASGGFVAPFVCPELKWDFRLSRVVSINASGHKYGLTYPGIGWAVWRTPDHLPKDLIFNINYLGSEQASFTLNFSKGASNVIAQYYVFIRLGKAGFKKIMNNLIKTSDHLAAKLSETGRFRILSACHGKGLPLVAFCLTDQQLHYDEFDIAAHLRERGWIVPAYTMCHAMEKLKLLRVVVREDFSRSRCEFLIRDILAVLSKLDRLNHETMEHDRAIRKQYGHMAIHKKPGSYTHGARHQESKGKGKQAPGVC